MDKKNITPAPYQPINRITSGQLPAELAELSEEILQDESLAPALLAHGGTYEEKYLLMLCSFDGDDAE
jgi:bacteriocin leader peptide (microcyclamide/patellamide family)